MTAVLFVAGAVVTLDAGLRVGRSILGATIGRRWSAYARLRRLSALTTLEYFSSLLGPPAFSAAGNGVDESIWVDRYYYVLAHSTHGDHRVYLYSVTSRARSFRPRVPFPGGGLYGSDQWKPYEARLCRTPFADVCDIAPKILGALGARRLWYSELYYFGNPGHYQTLVLSLSDAGPREALSDLVGALQGQIGVSELEPGHPDLARFRRHAPPNTYSVSGPLWNGDTTDLGIFTADLDTVRVLPQG